MAKPVPYMECSGCEQDMPMTEETAMLAIFTEEECYNYVLVQCIHCGSWNRNFIDEENVQKLKSFKIPVHEVKYAPYEVVDSYCETRGIENLKPHDLTLEEEHLVEFFRWLLEAGRQE